MRLSKFILFGCGVGDGSKIGAFVEIQKNAKVGKNCKISSHSIVFEGVSVEGNVLGAHIVTFINDEYPRASASEGQLQAEKGWKIEPTLVKKGAAVGCGATLLSNFVIRENPLVGAGSVMTHDVPDNAIVTANPARLLRLIAQELRVAS